jgi:hypothetical protein
MVRYSRRHEHFSREMQGRYGGLFTFPSSALSSAPASRSRSCFRPTRIRPAGSEVVIFRFLLLGEWKRQDVRPHGRVMLIAFINLEGPLKRNLELDCRRFGKECIR